MIQIKRFQTKHEGDFPLVDAKKNDLMNANLTLQRDTTYTIHELKNIKMRNEMEVNGANAGSKKDCKIHGPQEEPPEG